MIIGLLLWALSLYVTWRVALFFGYDRGYEDGYEDARLND